MKPPSCSVVVPVYNSRPILPELVDRLSRVLPGISSDYELILVNDGSRDQSWDAVAELARRYPWVRGLNLMKNYGQHNALLCGVRAARHEIVVTMDDDLQHPPEEIHKLLNKLAEGHDVVYGSPEKESHGLLRDLSSQITKLALKSAMGVEIARHVGAFRAFKASLLKSFADYRNSFVSIDVLLTWGAADFAHIPVRHEPRRAGKSNYTFGKLVSHALNMMTGFSTLPLQFASMIGFLFTLFGAGVLCYVVGRYLIQGRVVPGFAFLASIIAIFSGAQLFALGIIGEYLARMHSRSMERPSYVVKENCGFPHAA